MVAAEVDTLPAGMRDAVVRFFDVNEEWVAAVLADGVSSGELVSTAEAYSRRMPAYLIVETDITDPERYEQYKAASPGAIAAAGGRFIARGGELAVLEGDWHPKRLVLVEFPDLETAKRFYESEEYRAAMKLREGAANLNMVAVEGV